MIIPGRNILLLMLLLLWGMIIFPAEAQKSSGPIFFEREKLRFDITDTSYALTGDYYFRNRSDSDSKTKIFYPFVVNSDLPYPHYIQIKDLINNQTVSFKKQKTGVLFWVEIPAYSTRVYRIVFFQKIFNRRMEYILTTTAFWNQPLESADFRIFLPKTLELDSLSMQYQRIEQDSNGVNYFFNYKNFMPKKNLIIQWRCRHD